MNNQRLPKDYKEGLLESLNEKERKVLYRLIEGKNIPQIAKGLGYVPSTVRNRQTDIYKKFGIFNLDDDEKRKTLIEEYGDLVRKFKSEDEFVNWIRPKPEEDFFSRISQPQEPVKTHPSVDAVTGRFRIEPTPPPPPIRTVTLRNVLVVMGVGVVLIIAAVIILGGDRTPPAIPATVSESNKLVYQSPTITSRPSVASTNTLVPIPTKTRTPRPTSTKTLTPTQTSPPTPYPLFPFVDGFDSGLDTAWTVYGNHFVIDGQLTTDDQVTILVGNKGWKNYDIELSYKAKGCNRDDQNFIGLRTQSPSSMIALKWNKCQLAWYFVRDGVWDIVPGSPYELFDIGPGVYGGYEEDRTLFIKVKDNRLYLTTEGVQLSEIYIPLDQMKNFESGGVSLGIYEGAFVDKITITGQNPETIIPTLTQATSDDSDSDTQRSSVVQLPFEDEFESSINPNWRVNGETYVVNGELATSEIAWVYIGDETWKDYRIDIGTGGYSCFLSQAYPSDYPILALRVTGNSYIGLVFSHCAVEWCVSTGGDCQLIDGTYTWVKGGMDNFSFEVKDGKFSFFYNNEKFTELVDPAIVQNFTSGGIGIKLNPDTTLRWVRINSIFP